ncbi:hypothetical protein AcV5_005131 [Taiwanofungus camphoratus]|nr:hypothetical protein AcV5_005131 [Antrodia cinnamomea]
MSDRSAHLFYILRGYAALSPPKLLTVPSRLPFTELHDFLLNLVLFNSHLQVYPPSQQYQISFWKWAIQQLEERCTSEDTEIDERIYSHLISLMPLSCSGNLAVPPPTESYVTYFWKTPQRASDTVEFSCVQKATLLESRMMIESGTTGLRTWTASLVMAQHLILHPDLVQGRRILELGAGVGFLGIVIATLQLLAEAPEKPGQPSPALCLTDANDAVLRRCQDNVRLSCNLSSRHPSLSCYLFDWSDGVDPLRQSIIQDLLRRINAEIIIGTDLVYEPSIIPALISTLYLALKTNKGVSSKGTVAYIALTVRNEATFGELLRTAGAYNYVRTSSAPP